MSSFCSAKATHILSAKNIRILYIESAKTVNEMTLNELVNDALNNWAMVVRHFAVPLAVLCDTLLLQPVPTIIAVSIQIQYVLIFLYYIV